MLYMKYHIWHDFRSFTLFKEISSDHFEDLYKLKLLTNFDVNLTSSPGLCIKRLTHLSLRLLEMKSDHRICQEFQFIRTFKMIRGFCLHEWSNSSKSCRM